MSSQPREVLLEKVHSIAEKAAKKAAKSDAGVEFLDVLGSGTHGTVYDSKLTAPVPVLSEGCVIRGRPLKQIDPTPAVKLSEEKRNDSGAKLKSKREFELMRWAYQQKVGPPVYCEATWDLGDNNIYHLIFMTKMYGSLLTLIENKKIDLATKQLAWIWTFEKVYKVSNAKPPSIGIDFKPENVLMSTDKNHHLIAAFLADFDSKFWKSVKSSKEALLFNYVTLVSNTLFPPGSIEGVCAQLPYYVRTFAHQLVSRWSRSDKFYRYLLKWDKQFQLGVYHYALKNDLASLKTPEARAEAYRKRLGELQHFYGNFECGKGANVIGAKEALDEGNRQFM